MNTQLTETIEEYQITEEVAKTIVVELLKKNEDSYANFLNLTMISDNKELISQLAWDNNISKKDVIAIARKLKNYGEEQIELDTERDVISIDDDIVDSDKAFDMEEEYEENEVVGEKKKKPKKEKAKGGIAKFVISGILLVLLVAGYFVNSILQEMMEQKSKAPEIKNSISYEPGMEDERVVDNKFPMEKNVNGYAVAPSLGKIKEPKALNIKSKEQSPIKKDYSQEVKKNTELIGDELGIKSVSELELLGIKSTEPKRETSGSGGVCNLVPKHKNTGKEYIYFTFSNGAYTPIHKDSTWTGKGVVLNDRMVILSNDEVNGLVEIEDGKFLPIELFTACSVFK